MTKYIEENYLRGALGAAQAEAVKQHVEARDPLPPEKVEELHGRVKTLQDKVGYDGDYDSWIANVTPPDLE